MTQQFTLAVDVGNTRAKFGVFETATAAAPQVVEISAVRLANTEDLAHELQQWLTLVGVPKIRCAIIAGSNPPARDGLLESWPLANSPPRLVESHVDLPIEVDVDEPARVGIDRLLTAYAAHRLFAARQTAIVVDSGTATTVNLVTSDGVFRGGSILPGLRLSAYALHDYTARLPLINIDNIGQPVEPSDAPVPGRNTDQAIRSGLFWGQLGAIKELQSRLSFAAVDQFSDRTAPACLLTGGGGRQLSPYLSPSVYIDSLALHGLALLSTSEKAVNSGNRG